MTNKKIIFAFAMILIVLSINTYSATDSLAADSLVSDSADSQLAVQKILEESVAVDGASGKGAGIDISASSPKLRFNNSDNSNFFDFGMSGTNFRIYSKGTFGKGIVIDQYGKVGIGTWTPFANLHLITANSTETRLRIESMGESGMSTIQLRADSQDVFFALNKSKNLFSIAKRDSDPTNFLFDATPSGALGSQLYLSMSGNIGIGTTSPASKLTVIGNADISENLNVNGTISLPLLASQSCIGTDSAGNLQGGICSGLSSPSLSYISKVNGSVIVRIG